MEGAATAGYSGVWPAALSTANESFDSVVPQYLGASPTNRDGEGGGVVSASSSQQSLFTVFHTEASSTGGVNEQTATSAMQLQQNLQRLYGSMNHMGHSSRSSLPDIKEEGPGSSGHAALEHIQQVQRILSSNNLGAGSKVASEDDL
jgi:hypothetical protein